MKINRAAKQQLFHFALLMGLLTTFVQPLRADVLCYRASAKKVSNKNALRVYRTGCPKGFTALSSELLGVDTMITQGAAGSAGLKGVSGSAGDSGPQGARGLQGDVGLKGAMGVAGIDGAQGGPGAKGETGDPGVAGLSASDLFFFNGGTGSTEVGSQGELQIYPFTQTNGPTTGFIDPATLMVPIGSSCSAVAFTLSMEDAPGAGNMWQFFILSGDYEATPLQEPLCTLTGPAKSCLFTKKLTTALTSSSSIALLAKKLGTTPAGTRARWSIRCTAA